MICRITMPTTSYMVIITTVVWNFAVVVVIKRCKEIGFVLVDGCGMGW